MKIIAGELCVRDINLDDADSYLEIFGNPQVARYDDFQPITSDDLVADMARLVRQADESRIQEYGVYLQPDNKMIGVITIERKRLYYYLGYHFNPASHGKGFAVRSVRAFVDALDEDKKSRLRLVSDPENKASLALAGKLGFKFLKRRKHKGAPELVFVYR
jgi:RimJ/RimL family protein N-acetyltransferase